MEPIVSGAPQAAGATLISDTTGQNFIADVIEASRVTPVIVDFWAPWCGPCKQLTPMLEKVVKAAGGKVRLVKLNIDDHPEIPRQLRVQSVPTVFAFVDGRPTDQFTGAQPESQVKAFVERLARMGAGAPSPVDAALEQAKTALESGDGDSAGTLYNQVLQQEPGNLAALVGVVRCLLAMGDIERARAALDGLPPEVDENTELAPDLAAARAALELAEQGAAAGDSAALLRRVEADPEDHRSRFDLALALHAGGDPAGAIDRLLEIVARQRDWNDEAARKQLLKVFEALGGGHPATLAGRRRLSSMLFS